jgi:hypothetical protein
VLAWHSPSGSQQRHTAQPYVTQKGFADLLELCHHLGILYIILKSLRTYGEDLNSFRAICLTLWNTKDRGKIAILKNLE